MKKFALISGLLFLVVYFWVNTLTRDGNSFDVEYPLVNAGTITNGESSSEVESPQVNVSPLPSVEKAGTTPELELSDVNVNSLPSVETAGATPELELSDVNVNSLPSVETAGATPETKLPSRGGETSRGTRTYIIVASFGDLEHARLVAEAYTSKYRTEIFVLPPTPDGNYRISYGSYSSSGEAKVALGTVRQTGFPDAWVLSPR